jgi:hypothetical protein
MKTLASYFTAGNTHGLLRTFPKCKAGLGYHLFLGPLFWELSYMTRLCWSRSLHIGLYIHVVWLIDYLKNNCQFQLIQKTLKEPPGFMEELAVNLTFSKN